MQKSAEGQFNLNLKIFPSFVKTQGLNFPLYHFTCVNILVAKQIHVSRSWRFLAVMKDLQILLSKPENAKARLYMHLNDDDSMAFVSFWWMRHLIKISRFRAEATGPDLMAAVCSFKEPLEVRHMTCTSLLQQMKSSLWQDRGSFAQKLTEIFQQNLDGSRVGGQVLLCITVKNVEFSPPLWASQCRGLNSLTCRNMWC